MKKIAVVLCLILACVMVCGCGKKDEGEAVPTPGSTSAPETQADEGIEFGGDIDEEGNITVSETEDGGDIEESESDAAPMTEVQAPELSYDEKGNITKESAVVVLQQYTSEILGLTPNIGHQLLFDPNTSEVNGKSCYVIAAKIPDGDTEGVFYVSLDGKDAYKYDLENQQYIKLP